MNSTQNQMRRTRYNDTIEIDLVVLCKKALKKWKMILLFCILGAVAGAGIANARYWWNENHQPEFKKEDLDKSKARLTEEELKEADHVFDQYSTYFRVQEARSKHINDSILMTLNAETAAVLERRYLISSDQSSLVDTLQNMTLNPAGYQRIASAAGCGLTEQDVEEMVMMTTSLPLQNWEDIVLDGNSTKDGNAAGNTNTSGNRNGTGNKNTNGSGKATGNINTSGNDSTTGNEKNDSTESSLPEGLPDTKYSNVITITAMGNDEASCKKLFDETEAIMKESVAELKTLDKSLSMTPFGEDPVKDGAETILKRQQELLESVTQIINIRKQFNQDVVSKLTKNQKAYFEQLQLRDNAKEPESKDSRGMMKFAAVGFLLGAVICFVIICYPFLFGGHYQSAGELESTTGIRLIAAIKKNAPKDGNDNSITSAARMTAEELRAWEKDGGNIFYFATDDGFTTEHPFCNQLKQEYTDSNLLMGNPLKDPEAMADMLKSNGVILGISVDNSKRENAKRLYITAMDHDVPVLGYIAEDTL